MIVNKLNINEVLMENQRAMTKVRNYIMENEETYGTNPKFYLNTYGCQMNEHDSEKIYSMLRLCGFSEAESMKDADFVLYNTCCIRENAEKRVYGNLGSLKTIKNQKKHMIIAICGCMMQRPHIVEKIKEKYKHVDIVFGTHNLHEFPTLFLRALTEKKMIVEVWEKSRGIVEGIKVVRKKPHKAFVNITYGCNNYCTYCVVPYTRGRERSRDKDSILKEVNMFLAEGVKEITLLGQNVNSYGNDFDYDYTFGNLLRDVAELDYDFRLNFMTPHPKDFSDDVIMAIKECDKIVKYVHLPVQAGSTKVLKRMNRSYTREQYLSLVDRLRANIDNLSISTDIIIGFPSEEEEDVDQLIDLIKYVEYDTAFTFIYSVREGTPAAKFEQIPDDIKHVRFERMLKVLNGIVIRKNQEMKGKVVRVLVDSHKEGKLTGRSDCNRSVSFAGDASLIGTFQNVLITNPKKFSLIGEIVEG